MSYACQWSSARVSSEVTQGEAGSNSGSDVPGHLVPDPGDVVARCTNDFYTPGIPGAGETTRPALSRGPGTASRWRAPVTLAGMRSRLSCLSHSSLLAGGCMRPLVLIGSIVAIIGAIVFYNGGNFSTTIRTLPVATSNCFNVPSAPGNTSDLPSGESAGSAG